MFAHLYQNFILKNPKAVFALLLIAILSFGYYSKDFRLDASSETLLIEGDPDLAYLKEITERYGSKDFLILTYTPNEGMVTDSSINNLLSLKYKIQSLDWVHSVITLLDIPLLNNSDAPLQERLKSFKTLKDEDVDRNRGFQEILNSPVFRNFVISENGNTSGIIVNIKENKKLENIEEKSKEEVEDYKDRIKKQNHENILEIRQVIQSYGDVGKIYLGGIPMIADDMMTFIKSDIVVFGLGVLLFIIATLWFVFRKLIWIIVPISSCLFSVVIMMGLLGILGWKVTVISSNFIALMLILTMAMNIHMSTRFLQLRKDFPKKNNFEIISLTTNKMFWPIIYTVFTTVFAFLSLIFSGIKPIIDFGWMMSFGLITSFIVTFTLLPTLLSFVSDNNIFIKKTLDERMPIFEILSSEIEKSNFSILDAIEKLNLTKSRSDTKRLIKSKGIKIFERKIRPEEMENFVGCFLTGTAAEVTPVSQIDKYKFTVCNVIKDLSESYQNLVRKKTAV